MSREIKFQVILENKIIGEIGTIPHFDLGAWWFVDYRLPEDDQILDCGLGHLFPNAGNSSFNTLTYRGYLGFHDKNGKEIYAGDIVESIITGSFVNGFTNKKMTEYRHYPTVEVIWRDQDACYSPMDDEDFSLSYCAVIGNIYESPELKP